MPFVSRAQQRFMHANPEILGKKGLHEWDEATKGHYKSLPDHVKHDASYKHARKARKENGD